MEEEEKMDMLHQSLIEAKEVMVMNLEAVLDKGVKINAVLAKVQEMKGVSVNFGRDVTAYKNQERNRNIIFTAVLVALGLFILYIIYSYTMGSSST